MQIFYLPSPAGQAAPPVPVAATPATCPVCPSLPSSDTAFKVIKGEPFSLLLMFRDLILRSGIVGIGLYIAGEREHLLRNSLAGGIAIEAFVLAWIAGSTHSTPIAASGRPIAHLSMGKKYPWANRFETRP